MGAQSWYSNPFCFKYFSSVAVLCFREATHFKIARHAFLLTATTTASVGGEPSGPCDSPAPPKESSSSTLVQELFQKVQNRKKFDVVVVSHGSYYLCKPVGKFPQEESVQFCNAR